MRATDALDQPAFGQDNFLVFGWYSFLGFSCGRFPAFGRNDFMPSNLRSAIARLDHMLKYAPVDGNDEGKHPAVRHELLRQSTITFSTSPLVG